MHSLYQLLEFYPTGIGFLTAWGPFIIFKNADDLTIENEIDIAVESLPTEKRLYSDKISIKSDSVLEDETTIADEMIQLMLLSPRVVSL